MKKLTFIFSCFLLLQFQWTAIQAQTETVDTSIDKERQLQAIQIDVAFLSSDLLEGRETGKAGEDMAAKYLVMRFEELGLKPKGTDGTWYHTFDFNFNSNPHLKKGEARTGKNVVAAIDNEAAEWIVIGAHFDHLGYGHFGSRYTGEEKKIHNGADDNASGVAAMLYLAEYLKDSKAKNFNYLFIGFSGEEMGLFGSKNYTKTPTIDLSKVNYMLNMDMIGRLNEEKVLAISGTGTTSIWKEELAKIEVNDIQIKTSDSGIGPSDHTSFYLKDIPVLHFFTGQHTDYHKPEDDSHLVNYEGIHDISNFMFQLIENIDGKGKLPFIKTKDDSEGRKVSKFKVTLGVMPDYVSTDEGMKVDSVIEGRPGFKAGMKDGDVIVKMGDKDVNDIYDYMEGLAQFKEGDKTTIKVKRGDKEVKLKVEF
ncbi:MAG: M20/M25/M40 family metallo-hydrolase [Chitinophagales bacterium]